MRVKSDSEILSLEVRRQILSEIKSAENQERKKQAYKRYLCLKDQTKQFVIEQLLKQFDKSTVDEMKYCIANVSITRKIIEKLARVYNNGVKREVGQDEQSEENIKKLEKELDFNTAVRTANKFLKLQKNIAMYIKPCPVIDNQGNEKYTIKLEPMSPYLYDVVENFYDRTKPMVYILSDFDYTETLYTIKDPARNRDAPVPSGAINPYSDKKDQAIADSPSDAKTGEVIWWSNNYHFTTDYDGNIISQGDGLNPIGEMPIENFAIDQDGQFWAIGGDDLIDGSILINAVLTHNQNVGITQGYGQFWMKGKNLPTAVTVGPNKVIRMEYQEGEPTPDLGFANASPQIDSLRGLVESYIALLLTTNNLSTSAVASSLNGAATAPSGIAMVIDKSESMEDVNDQRQIFVDKEPAIWRKINKWLNLYGDQVVEGLSGLSLAENFEENFSLNFIDAPVIVSEQEKLANLKARKELGIDSMIDLIMKDNPQLTEDQAKEKLAKILKDNIEKQLGAENASQGNQSLNEQDQLNDRPEVGAAGPDQSKEDGTA